MEPFNLILFIQKELVPWSVLRGIFLKKQMVLGLVFKWLIHFDMILVCDKTKVRFYSFFM